MKLSNCAIAIFAASILATGAVIPLFQLQRVRAADTEPQADLPKAFIDGAGIGWRDMQFDEFINQNCYPDTWKWENGLIQCTGIPNGVLRTKKLITNFELVVEWRHLKKAGNSGVYVWVTEDSLKDIKPGKFPDGIEVQVLDHGYKEEYEKSGKKADWFTTNGDVFPTGKCDMKPFPPVAPDGKRAFPRKNLSKGLGEWNHYYIRAINGEVRLWVNGEEVSGGTDCKPATGFLALESEGSTVEFKHLRIRELP